MTTMPQPKSLASSYTGVYDAWNRLVEIKDSSTVAEYEYDGLNRRIVKTVGSDVRHFYYSISSQVLEERVGTSTNADIQYIWGTRYIDDLILRDRDTNTNGTLDERLYALQDANWNIIALTDETGTVKQRFQYTPYGSLTKLDPDFTPFTGTDYKWEYTYTSRRLDDESGLMYYRARYYHPELGRFINRDPIGYVDGKNLFLYVSDSPVSWVDPSGLEKTKYHGKEKCDGLRKQRTKMLKQLNVIGVNREERKAGTVKRPKGSFHCKPPCVLITILIKLGHSCDKDIVNRKISHTGMGIGDDFFDYGPDRQPGEEDTSLAFGVTGGGWWSHPRLWPGKQRPSLADIYKKLNKLSHGLDVIRFEMCACKTQDEDADYPADEMRKIWEDRVKNPGTYKIPGTHCTSVVWGALNCQGPIGGGISPEKFLEQASSLRHRCGDEKGKLVMIERIQTEFDPNAN